jgi:ArsR family transcriptional regulator, arsenate/arsenite/antimonite-responsive transcriptional repressor
MVKAKSDLFKENLNESAAFFKALSHPARLQILQYLAASQSCITGDISDELPLSRTTVNQHIKELKDIGLIQGTIEGVRTKYCLNADRIEELKHLFGDFYKTLVVGACKSNSCN